MIDWNIWGRSTPSTILPMNTNGWEIQYRLDSRIPHQTSILHLIELNIHSLKCYAVMGYYCVEHKLKLSRKCLTIKIRLNYLNSYLIHCIQYSPVSILMH
jgi:hypothetical protein